MFTLEECLLLLAAVLIGNFLCSRIFRHSIFYLYYRIKIVYQNWRLRLKYNNFFTPPLLNKNNKNILFLCHGRLHGVPISDNDEDKIAVSNNKSALPLRSINIGKYNCYTVDIEINTKPYYNYNVCDEKLYEHFPDESFDYIVLFNCNCHTTDINNDLTIISRLKRILKDKGELIIKYKGIVGIAEAGFYATATYPFYFKQNAVFQSYSNYIKGYYLSYDITVDPILLRSFRKTRITSLEKKEVIISLDTDEILLIPEEKEVVTLQPYDKTNINSILNQMYLLVSTSRYRLDNDTNINKENIYIVLNQMQQLVIEITSLQKII
jgi:hypothetical protein